MEELFDEKADPQIESDFLKLTKGYSCSIQTEWLKYGENFKQFSIYTEEYSTRSTNQSSICQVGVIF